MAFNNALGDRKDDMRFHGTQSLRDEPPLPGYPATLRNPGARMQPVGQPHDPRTSLQRRFTTESAQGPTMTPIGQPQRGQVAEPLDLSSSVRGSTLHKVQLLEKKRHEYEILREQRRRFEAEMQLIDLQQQKEEQEIMQMTEALGQVTTSAGYQSEPTTPPEYRDSGFPSSLSRPNRFSTSSLTSPPGLNKSVGSQLASPVSELPHSQVVSNKMPSKSVPGSRRNSDEDEPKPVSIKQPVAHRAAARNSMPAAGVKFHTSADDQNLASMLSLGQINTTRFLFGEDHSDSPKGPTKKEAESTTSPKVKGYLQMNATDDNFPILVRHDDHPGLLSASSAALDLALSQSPGPESQSNGWPSFSRHRAQYSLPLNAITVSQNTSQVTSPKTQLPQRNAAKESPGQVPRYDRNSMDLSFGPFGDSSQTETSTATATTQATPPKLQGSYSTNDIPTMKSGNGLTGPNAPANTHAQQHFHNHNASLGRIPVNAVNNRHSREINVGETTVAGREGSNMGYQPFQSVLQASAAPFGPPLSTSASGLSTAGPVSPQGVPQVGPSSYYGGYGGMPAMNMNMPLNIPNAHVTEQAYQQHNPFAFQMYGYQGRGYDSQARVMQHRRVADGEANRFANVQLENLRGEIYSLCKDQHGCRYLQKKLEDRDAEHIQMIYLETHQHVVELMTDPFGNYLCQKLLEYSNDEQRTGLINNAAPHLVKIALNQHGTRALQKMIEFISTPEQVQTIIYALRDRVVELIQDLNGNHVIQKCLNRLSPEDAQFIFDAVGINCVVVGTHRHGCCVLQRCIDHASGVQKINLINQISVNAFPLVQDPFGNYVVQYILDLGEASYTEPLIRSFVGHVPALSKQKFSSNVIEKCLRTAEPSMKKLLIEEMLQSNELERMLRDSYANYVIQTAMDFADPDTKSRLVENIRPILPAIRSTPYGRRIQGKIQALDGRSGNSSGQITPNDASSPGQIPLGRPMQGNYHRRQSSNLGQNGFPNAHGSFGTLAFGPSGGNTPIDNISGGSAAVVGGAAQALRLSNPSFPTSNQTHGHASVQQPFPAGYGRGTQSGGPFYF
ncbi:MAG: hypothetical protein M1832_002564 [Thelocarpon impressellum]|nr:MAG: hypothetical protein M1832_002564 [Thelocarpon impressellum]